MVRSRRSLFNQLVWSVSMIIFSCQPQTPIADANGNLSVLIPMVAKNSGSDTSQLENVTIKNITSLKNVSGSYAQFYYAPGSGEGSLTGSSPQARYIRTKQGTFVPSDVLTQQMFSLYYHVQNLNDFNAEISPELKQTVPFYIGLNTQVANDPVTGTNNAFFDGDTNSLLFVPYNLKGIPISVNSGIIAHEFFHSVFFKQVLKGFNAQQESVVQNASDKEHASKVYYFNQTYIRGLNEGIADFWGWLYTNNVDYISISLPKFGGDRKLVLPKDQIGIIESQDDIENKVSEAQSLNADNPTQYLSGYIYRIGTPHARFLKELTVQISNENKITLDAAKLLMAKTIYGYLKRLAKTTAAYKSSDIVSASDLFKYFAQPKVSGLSLTEAQCDFILKYVDVKDAALKPNLCVGSVK